MYVDLHRRHGKEGWHAVFSRALGWVFVLLCLCAAEFWDFLYRALHSAACLTALPGQ